MIENGGKNHAIMLLSEQNKRTPEIKSPGVL